MFQFLKGPITLLAFMLPVVRGANYHLEMYTIHLLTGKNVLLELTTSWTANILLAIILPYGIALLWNKLEGKKYKMTSKKRFVL